MAARYSQKGMKGEAEDANEVEADYGYAPRSIGETVKRLREKLGHALAKGELKGTLADYIKLIQLEKELIEDEPRDIVVTWVSPEEMAAKRKSLEASEDKSAAGQKPGGRRD